MVTLLFHLKRQRFIKLMCETFADSYTRSVKNIQKLKSSGLQELTFSDLFEKYL